jgi:orc1/cdc6 family replication initiation protein
LEPDEIFARIEKGEDVEIKNPRKHYINDGRYIEGTYLPPDFGIENILYRDKQKKYLGEIFLEALRGNRAPSCYIDGRTGTGKTVLTQLYMELAEKKIKMEKENSLIFCYIDCKDIKSNWGLAVEIASRLSPETIKKRGLPFHDYTQMIFKTLEDEQKRLILVLDEIEKPIRLDDSDEFLFELGNQNEEWGKKDEWNHITIISITNDRTLYSRLRGETQSRVGNWKIHFDRYKQGEILGLLEQRAKRAFNNNVDYYEAISVISSIVSAESGNLRTAIEMLNHSFRVALEDHIKSNHDPESVVLRITKEHAELTRAIMDREALEDQIKRLKLHEKILFVAMLLLHKVHPDFLNIYFIQELYEVVCEAVYTKPKTRRSNHDVLTYLHAEGIIEILYGKGRSVNHYRVALDDYEVNIVLTSTSLGYPLPEVIQKRNEILEYFFKSAKVQKFIETYKISKEKFKYIRFSLPKDAELRKQAQKEVHQYLGV